MKLKLEISPDLAALMQAEIAAGEKAVTIAMREAGAGLKSAWRGQITGAGLGTRLGNSIRLATYPKGGESLNAAALVWSNAPVIVGAHDTGLCHRRAGKPSGVDFHLGPPLRVRCHRDRGRDPLRHARSPDRPPTAAAPTTDAGWTDAHAVSTSPALTRR